MPETSGDHENYASAWRRRTQHWPGRRLEAGFEARTFDILDEAVHQLEVHAADELGVVLRERVERAVDQGHAARVVARLVAALAQDVGGRGDELRSAAPRPACSRTLLAELCPTSRAASRSESATGTSSRSASMIARASSRAGELVVAFGQADRDLARRTSVELRRAARARSAPSRRRRYSTSSRPSSTSLSRWNLATWRATPAPSAAWSRFTGSGLGHHVAVEGSAQRFAQRRDAGHARVEGVGGRRCARWRSSRSGPWSSF